MSTCSCQGLTIKVKDFEKGGDYPGLSRWAQSNHKTPWKMRTSPSCGQLEWPQKKCHRDGNLLVLRIEGGATSQGMWVTSKSWKRQGNTLSPRAFRFMWDNKFILCEAIKLVVVYYITNRKLVHIVTPYSCGHVWKISILHCLQNTAVLSPPEEEAGGFPYTPLLSVPSE